MNGGDPTWVRAEAIFHDVVHLSAEDRAVAIRAGCQGDASMRARVEVLLAASDENDELDEQGTSATSGDEAPPEDRLIGRTIGGFKIVRVLGRGGMGMVYEARQEQPRRLVALKMLARGLASRTTLRRFRSEIEVLGNLDHPGIARLYEAGTLDEGEGGVPWFAMERIANARPLLRFAKESNLTTRARLELFATVCDAVSHGHLKGIVHRDLKPANILVDANGHAKLIDFGIARATESDIAVTTIGTDAGALLGTVAYMSPEQCRGDSREIDLRSDIYSLGVLLYELLTETKPYDLTHTSILGATRIVQEATAGPMSRINRSLRGDLETVVATAMEKDASRRYQSARELAEDIRRFLKGEAILAKSPTAGYLLGCFIKRHRGLVAASAAVILLLFAATITSTVWYLQASESTDQAIRAADRSKNDQAVARIVSAVSPPQSTQRAQQALESLDPSTWEHRYAAAAINEALMTVPMQPGFNSGWVSQDGRMLLQWSTAQSTETAVQIARFDLVERHWLEPWTIQLPEVGLQIQEVRASAPDESGVRVIAVILGAVGTRGVGGVEPGQLQLLHLRDGDSTPIVRETRPVPGVMYRCLLLSLDHGLVACCTRTGHLHLWQLHGGDAGPWRLSDSSTSIDAFDWTPMGLAISPDGRLLAGCGMDCAARIWDVEALKNNGASTLLATLLGHRYYVMDVNFSPDGTMLATAGNDGSVRIWDVAAAIDEGAEAPAVEPLTTREARRHAIWAQRHAVISKATTEAVIAVIPAEPMSATGAVFDRQGVLHTAGERGVLRAWALVPTRRDGRITALDVEAVGEQTGAGQLITKLFTDHSRSKIISQSIVRQLQVWSRLDMSRLSLRGASTGCLSIAAMPDNRHVAIGVNAPDGRAIFYDLDAAAQVGQVWHGHAENIWDMVSWTWAGRMMLAVAVGTDHENPLGRLVVWDVTDPRSPIPVARTRLDESSRGFASISVVDDGDRIAIGFADGRVASWDLVEGTDGTVLSRVGEAVRAGTADLDERSARLRGINGLACVPDQPDWVLSAGADGGLVMVNLSTGELSMTEVSASTLGEASMDSGMVLRAAAISGDGRWAAAGDVVGRVYWWRLDTTVSPPALHDLHVVQKHGTAIQSVGFLDDGGPTRLVSASDDGSIDLHDPETGDWAFTLEGYPGSIRHLAITSDGRRIMAAGTGPFGRGNGGTIWEAVDSGERANLVTLRSDHAAAKRLVDRIRRAPFASRAELHQRVTDASADMMAPLDEAGMRAALSYADLFAMSDRVMWRQARWILQDAQADHDRLQEALHWTTKAIAAAPDRIEPWSLHVAALARLGRFEEALQHSDLPLSMIDQLPKQWARGYLSLTLLLHAAIRDAAEATGDRGRAQAAGNAFQAALASISEKEAWMMQLAQSPWTAAEASSSAPGD